MPTLAAGQACPRATGRLVVSGAGDALGDGPVYPVGLGVDGRLHVQDSAFGLTGKVLWIASPAYGGQALVRGARIDGPGTLGFSLSGGQPSPELRLEHGSLGEFADGWSDWPSETYVPALGCFAFQVDGVGLSEVIVFEVTEAPGG